MRHLQNKPSWAFLTGPNRLAVGVALACWGAWVHAAEPVSADQAVVVTATRTAVRAFDVPASIDRVDSAQIREDRALVNISEGLALVPGLLARDRQNFAQDVQISVRGFGARSTFGIRGVRLYVDGIPATLPDGQGQLSNVDLASVDRIEVLRGPMSALYGNSSGGVVQVFTEPGQGPPRVEASVLAGSDQARRVGLKASGAQGPMNYLLSTSLLEAQGYREHSAVRRQLGNAKLGWTAPDGTQWTLVANSVDMPRAQDPLGLTRAQFDSDPRAVDATAKSFDTRKTVSQSQAGLVVDKKLGTQQSLRVMVYGGHRSTTQYQSIPVATQASALHPGGVIQLGRDYSGLDLRWTLALPDAAVPWTLVAGLSHDTLREQRRGYQNFVGSTASPTLGVMGALRRNEQNDARNTDPYLQTSLVLTPKWTLQAGVRRSAIRFQSQDHYVQGINPDDSGQIRYAATLPALGVLHALNEQAHVYASWGRGFETPTLNELAYRADGVTGLNLALQASTSQTQELGIKLRLPLLGDVRAALFNTQADNEIVTYSNVGGRSTFRNAGQTRRRGAELSWSTALGETWRLQNAYTLLDARYDTAFATCTAAPCATPNQQVPAGNRIPGVARAALSGALSWQQQEQPQGLRASLEWRALSRVPVNDLNNDAAGGFATASASLGWSARLGSVRLSAFGRVENLFARKYAGSVIVNEGNGRTFEPASGRTALLGFSVSAAI